MRISQMGLMQIGLVVMGRYFGFMLVLRVNVNMWLHTEHGNKRKCQAGSPGISIVQNVSA